ncbi:MAG: hypothetical protein HY647_06945 [Acidobacteria bacterium]|nr:hypothetical protein [Acidobacteriota bacterium]
MGFVAGIVFIVGWLTAIPLLAQSSQASAQSEPWMNAPPTSTGLEAGQKIPSFRARDQQGQWQDFNSIRGPKGAVIMFNRSADW